MEIKDLKQPYRRMAEYLVTQNCIQEASDGIYNFYEQGGIMDLFCNAIDKGHNPPITEEIKKYFPADFDFSGEEENNTKSIMLSLEELFNLILETHTELSKMGATGMVSTGRVILNNIDKVANLNKENQRKIEDENLQKRIYTQLAKEGKFYELPDTCEFSEAVELEVWDNELQKKRNRLILGKFKGAYLEEDLTAWHFAQLPTPKIDFSQFKTGDVVEVETNDNSLFLGYFSEEKELNIDISYTKDKRVGLYPILKEFIKSITKIK